MRERERSMREREVNEERERGRHTSVLRAKSQPHMPHALGIPPPCWLQRLSVSVSAAVRSKHPPKRSSGVREHSRTKLGRDGALNPER